MSRLNPESGWIIQNVAGLRIVDQNLWEMVKARQATLTATRRPGEAPGYWDRRRARYLHPISPVCREAPTIRAFPAARV